MAPTADQVLNSLKFTYTILVEYYQLLERVAELEKKYGVAFSSINEINLTSGQTVDILRQKLPLDKLGLLFIATSELQSAGDLNKYFTLEPTKQEEMRKGIKKAIETLTKIIEGT